MAVAGCQDRSVSDDECARQRSLLASDDSDEADAGKLAEASARGQPSRVMR